MEWALGENILKSAQVWLAESWTWLQENFLEPERLLELLIIGLAVLLGRLSGRFLIKFVKLAGAESPVVQKLDERIIGPIATAALSLLYLWTARLLLTPVMAEQYLLPLATSLAGAWVIIRVLAGFIARRELARLVALAVWGLAALNILGLLPIILDVLAAAKLPLGESEISVLDIIKGLLYFILFIWVALSLASVIERRVRTLPSVPASAQVLIAKAGRFTLLTIAVLLALNATGIDLTALAVFGGALGVGIGFGLQKVVGNFISGLILLLDRSIKPGDVIETGGTYGRINKLAARYTSVITRDGTEFLIPNEDMITQPVINWSHSDMLVRRRVPVQVSYGSDIRKAMALMAEAALGQSRVLRAPAPRTLLREFGDNGVNLELRFWINDPAEGVSNISSAVMLDIWDKFHEEGIEFPFPQRVVHLARDTKADIKDVEN